MPCDQAGEVCPLAQALHSRAREKVLHLHHSRHGEEYVQIELLPLAGAEAADGEPAFFLE